MKRLLVVSHCLVMGALLVSCTRVVPLVPHAIPCEVSDELLAKECAKPSQLSEGTTFMDLVDKMRSDRKALQECDISQAALRESIKTCNKRIEEFNRKIDDLNNKNKGH